MDRPNTPKVSVVIGTFNRPAFLERALKSVAAQDYDNFEVIVHDDGSTPENIDAYKTLKIWGDSRFSFVEKDKSDRTCGPSYVRNKGIKISSGRYIALLDDDDWWSSSTHLNQAVLALEANSADFYFSDIELVTDGKTDAVSMYSTVRESLTRNNTSNPRHFRVEKKYIAAVLRHKNIHSNSLVIGRDLLNKVGFYWEKISYAEDYNMVFRLANCARTIIYGDMITACFNVSSHPSAFRSNEASERSIFAVAACLHAAAFVDNPHIAKTLSKNRSWMLLELAVALIKTGNKEGARHLIRESLSINKSFSALRQLIKTYLS